MIGAQGLKAGLSSTKPGHVSINSDLGLGDVCKEGPMLFKSTDSEDEEDGPEEDAAGARKGEDRGAAETSEDSDGDDDDDEEDSESTTENSAGDISDEEEDVGTGGKHDEDSLQVSSRASSSSSSSSSKTPPAVRPSRPRESAPAKRKALSSVSGSGHRSKKPRYTGTDLFPTVTKLEREIISIQDSLSDSTMAASAIITRNLSTSAKLKQVLAELQGLKEPKKKRSRVTVRPIPGEMSRRIRWKRGTRRK